MTMIGKNFMLASSVVLCMQTFLNANDKVALNSVEVTDTTFQEQVQSITSEKLDNSQASDIKDILKYIPGVVVDGNARYSQKVYARGLEDKFSNITIDGAKMEGQLFHHSGDQTIDAEMLKIGSIELGPNSALSGPGVVNASFAYETKDPSDLLNDDEKFGMRFSAGYQSAYERKNGNVAVFTKINDKIEFLAMGNISKDGVLEIADSKKVKSKQSTLKSGLAKVIFKPNEYHTLKLSYNVYDDGGKRQLSGEKPGKEKNDNNSENSIHRDTYTLNYDYTPDSDYININAKMYYNSQKLIREAAQESGSWTARDGSTHTYDDTLPKRTYENNTSGFDFRNTSYLSQNKLTYGVDYYHVVQKRKDNGISILVEDGVEKENGDMSATGGKIDAYGIYLEDEIAYNKWLLNIGARYDHHKLGNIYKGTYTQLSPKFKALYQVTNDFSVRTGYGKIFKGPTLGETMMINNKMKQADNTKAQTGRNIELGFDYNLSNFLNADSSNFGFTVYNYTLDNQMHPTKNGSLTNGDNSEFLGFESMFIFRKNKLGLNLSHSYVKGEDKNQETGKTNDSATSNIHTFKVGLDYSFTPKFNMAYDSEYVPGNKRSFYEDDKNVTIERSGYAVHNLYSTYEFETIKGAKLYIGVDNIFDKKYARHTSFGTSWGSTEYTPYEVGRNIKVKFAYQF